MSTLAFNGFSAYDNDEGIAAVSALRRQEPTLTQFAPAPTAPAVKAFAYNPYSLDSLAATALLLCMPGNEDARCMGYNQLEGVATLDRYNDITFVGAEASKADLELLAGRGAKLELFCYRGSYENVRSEMESESVLFQMPDDEHHSDLTDLTDNTMVHLVRMAYFKRGFDLPANVLGDTSTEILNLIARQEALAYPIMPMQWDLGQGADNEEELKNKARLYNLEPKLRVILTMPDPVAELKRLSIEADVPAYKANFWLVRQSFVRNTQKQFVGKGKYQRQVKTSAVAAQTYRDMLQATKIEGGDFLAYEDIRNMRLWRVFCEKRRDAESIAQSLKPLASWTEGRVLCVLTHNDVRV